MDSKPPRGNRNNKNNKNRSYKKGGKPRARPPRYDLDKINTPPKKRRQRRRGDEKKGKDARTFVTNHPDMRLNRFIANAGVCSRREADKLIQNGQIQVNGKVVREMGLRVKDGDEVRYKGQVIRREKPVYVLLNKPKDVITTTSDPQGRTTVIDLVKEAARERIYPVGRLDRQTTGLLLLTNDGEMAKRLTHPSHEVPKIYRVDLDKPITEADFEMLLNGVELEDGFIKPDGLAIVSLDRQTLGIEIHSGKNRIVRRLFEHAGYQVVKLDRTVYAGLSRGTLGRGKWRFLKEQEVIRLKFSVGKDTP